MNKSVTKLAQANVDHYNNHPKSHIAFAIIWLLGSVAFIAWLTKRIMRTDDYVDTHYDM